MAEGEKMNLRLESAHVLFIDIVGYSKLLIDQRCGALQELNTIVRSTEREREAETDENGKAVGDGDVRAPRAPEHLVQIVGHFDLVACSRRDGPLMTGGPAAHPAILCLHQSPRLARACGSSTSSRC